MVDQTINDNRLLIDRMLEDKRTMTLKQLSEKYHKRIPSKANKNRRADKRS
jgi:hypothetical protein